MSKCKKNDAGKARWDLLPIKPIEEVVDILTQGAIEYGPNSWQETDNFEERYYAAIMRHITNYRKGNIIDSKSKKHTLAHVMCNCVFLMEGPKSVNK